MAVKISKDVQAVIEKRGLKAADIEAVITGCGDDKITNGKQFIAKKVVKDVTIYARWTESGSDAIVEAGYCHKMKILDIVLEGEDSEWKYVKTGAVIKKGHTNLTYMGATRSGPSLVEPKSGASWFEEYLAAGALTAAEGLFQQKRA